MTHAVNTELGRYFFRPFFLSIELTHCKRMHYSNFKFLGPRWREEDGEGFQTEVTLHTDLQLAKFQGRVVPWRFLSFFLPFQLRVSPSLDKLLPIRRSWPGAAMAPEGEREREKELGRE